MNLKDLSEDTQSIREHAIIKLSVTQDNSAYLERLKDIRKELDNSLEGLRSIVAATDRLQDYLECLGDHLDNLEDDMSPEEVITQEVSHVKEGNEKGTNALIVTLIGKTDE